MPLTFATYISQLVFFPPVNDSEELDFMVLFINNYVDRLEDEFIIGKNPSFLRAFRFCVS